MYGSCQGWRKAGSRVQVREGVKPPSVGLCPEQPWCWEIKNLLKKTSIIDIKTGRVKQCLCPISMSYLLTKGLVLPFLFRKSSHLTENNPVKIA